MSDDDLTWYIPPGHKFPVTLHHIKHERTELVSVPFRFMDLPLEIRGRIYEMVLCEYQEAHIIGPAWEMDKPRIDIFRLLWNPKAYGILRASKATYKEGKNVVRKEDTFVKLALRISGEQISEMFSKGSLPILFVTESQARAYPHHVMTHRLTDSRCSSDVQHFLLRVHDFHSWISTLAYLG